MYSYQHEYEITPDYSIQGECFGFYIINGCIGVQVEDDGTWFNSIGPFLLSRSNELISAIELLINAYKNKEVYLKTFLPPFEIGIKRKSFHIGISDDYLGVIKEEYKDEYKEALYSLLEFNPSTVANVGWLDEIAIILPSLKVLIENIQI